MATVVVKLGGAAITDKSKADALSPDLDALVDEIAHAYQTSLRPHGGRMVLVHGAGSFGHPPAKQFQVKTGWLAAPGALRQGGLGTTLDDNVDDNVADDGQKRPPRQADHVKFGMALTRQRVLQLHHHVLQKLQDRARLPVLSVSTYDTVETVQGQLTPESSARLVDRVQKLLAEGFVPLLFGDAVFDLAWGSTILSGDALVHKLATELPGVRRCVFVTDVAGIYTRDPKLFPDATLVRRLRCSTYQGVERGDASASVDDVTGAMASKWQWVKRLLADAPHVRDVIICRASASEGALCAGAEDVDVYGAGQAGPDAHVWTTIVR